MTNMRKMSSITKEAAKMMRRKVPNGGNTWVRSLPAHNAKNNSADATPEVDAAHFKPLGSWTSEELDQSRAENPFAMGWAPSQARHAVPNMTHGEGVYVFDDKGNKYLDWTSQAVCVNLGHSVPQAVVTAVEKQMQELPYIYGGMGICPVRSRLSKLMSELTPGDITGFLFPSGGAEANEAAIRMARRYTARQKIL